MITLNTKFAGKAVAFSALAITMTACAARAPRPEVIIVEPITPPAQVVEPMPMPTPTPIEPMNNTANVDTGAVEASPTTTADIFRSVCIGGASPASQNMVQNPDTGSWYHQNYNIAIKDTGSVCSVIFGSNTQLATIQEAFPGEEEGLNAVRSTGAVLHGQPMYAAAYTRS